MMKRRLRPSGYGAAAFSRFASEGWWAVKGSNLRPYRCKRYALPAELTARTPVITGYEIACAA